MVRAASASGMTAIARSRLCRGGHKPGHRSAFRQQPGLATRRINQPDSLSIEARENATPGAPAFESARAVGEIPAPFETGETRVPPPPIDQNGRALEQRPH